MRIVQTVPARPEYFDRNASNKTISYVVGLANPHTTTLRAEYVVPAGKKAMLDTIMLFWRRIDIPTISGEAILEVRYEPSGGVVCYFVFKSLSQPEQLATYTEMWSDLGVLLPGDAIRFYTTDTSVGGGCSYMFTAKILEFDF